VRRLTVAVEGKGVQRKDKGGKTRQVGSRVLQSNQVWGGRQGKGAPLCDNGERGSPRATGGGGLVNRSFQCVRWTEGCRKFKLLSEVEREGRGEGVRKAQSEKGERVVKDRRRGSHRE